MQLILSIDDIGIKNNMSSAEETNGNEKEVKNPLLDKILSYSISNVTNKSTENEEEIVKDNQNSSNGIVTDDETSSLDILDKVQENSKTGLSEAANIENESDIIRTECDDSENISKEIKTDCKNDEDYEKNKDESTEQQSEVICDKNDNTDLAKGEMIEADESHLENIEVICKKDEEESHVQKVDLKQKDNVDEELMMIHESQLEDFETDNIENNAISENGVNDLLENIEAIENKNDTEENEATPLISEDIIDIADKKDSGNSTELENKVLENMPTNISDESTANTKIETKNVEEDAKSSLIPELDDTGISDESIENTKEEIAKKNIETHEKSNLSTELDIDMLDVSIENPKEISMKNIENDEKSNVITELDDIEISDESTENTKEEISTKNIQNDAKSTLISEVVDIDVSDECKENTKEEISTKNIESHGQSNFITNLDDTYTSNEPTENTDRDKSIQITEPTEPVQSLNLDKTCNSSQAIACEELQVHENTQNGEDINNLKVSSDVKTDPTNKVMNFKLSNMLDILSDDEDTTKPESPKQEPESESSDKQCINIEDDDDIMLIDDESTAKENESVENKTQKTDSDSNDVKELVDHVEKKQDVKENTVKNLQNNDTGLEDNKKINQEVTKKSKPEVKAIEKSPLLSTTTLKSFKKNLAEMTREELEDFCILKIVESVFDKSNLGEIKSQIKVLTQNIEDYKAKAKMLTKQNRDLQLVLKSVQEEQKKNSSAIVPLKITRSVGMQVLMTDKNARKRQGLLPAQTPLNPNINSPSTTNLSQRQNKTPVNTNTRNAKPQQPIPVPRLIPAVNVGTKTGPNTSPQVVNNPGKSPTVSNIPNGVKSTPPTMKPEKRSHSKMQQNSSVTVDLTDDEPPAKVNNRNFNPSVRCVPPQSLLAPQRSPLPQNINSPKKVYIPISGPQSQNIRPGQTIMLKSVTSPGTRPRGPSNNIKIAPNTAGAIRNARAVQRHPAPLPDLMKQYQPPNWKGLPPAPELKLAKVENGIVISWKIDGYREENHEEIASYQLFAYQETSAPPNTSLWKKIGDVKALPLPMACTLTQFMSGYKYYFAVRAIDVRSRFGPFSLPGSILLLKNQ